MKYSMKKEPILNTLQYFRSKLYDKIVVKNANNYQLNK